mmetsp:Transcript_17356/g.22281  ORF Transcript_17356/g.22281 Transcript_17356/m.22281 type:complete len:565 (+) Transcript_17356:58-1752(+)|eukprot:CAMPEP_0117854616 /NCGR_PEP_ID=MMETSP0950-20121206/123_1 /TAXON_ID=44440 /ORGANISM="Chattonella subsalsa, Strain CCMP2191" /LENGTH=564 /DNA_ID=CAMNT_0005703291 /DNA_START=36 /DNA_END=1730 /DNA_ORIENTATION=-
METKGHFGDGNLEGFDEILDLEVERRGATFRTYVAAAHQLLESGLVVCVHGAGFTGLSWSLMAKALGEGEGGCCVLAPDLRGHGATTATDPTCSTDLSTETLLADLVALIEAFVTKKLAEESTETAQHTDELSKPTGSCSASFIPMQTTKDLGKHSQQVDQSSHDSNTSNGSMQTTSAAQHAHQVKNSGTSSVPVLTSKYTGQLNQVGQHLQDCSTSNMSIETAENIAHAHNTGQIAYRDPSASNVPVQALDDLEHLHKAGQDLNQDVDSPVLSENRPAERPNSVLEDGPTYSNDTISGSGPTISGADPVQVLPAPPLQLPSAPTPPDVQTVEQRKTIKICLVGHSLGGTLVVRLAAQKDTMFSSLHEVVLEVTGLVVIDVVEGTALASLEYMDEVLDRIPQSFKSVEDGVTWAVKSRNIRNRRSAELSVPSRLKECEDGSCTWITNIRLATSYWKGWFTGLSELFLSVEGPTMLIVAGMDRLDTTLIIGQHQGRYQLKLVYNAGHAIHEDQPEEVAESIADFSNRYGILHKNIAVFKASRKDMLQEKLRRARQLRDEQKTKPP